MVANGDILELTLESNYISPGNVGLNVFQYRVQMTETFPLSLYGQEFMDEWYSYILDDLLMNIVSSGIAYVGMSAKNLTEPLEIWEGVPTVAIIGSATGDMLPPYAAYGFKLNRTTSLTRNGAKRFWGVTETMQTNGEPAGLAIVNLPLYAQLLGDAFSIVIDAPAEVTITMYPEIVRKDATGAMILNQDVLSARFTKITTQNTRKFGRGM